MTFKRFGGRSFTRTSLLNTAMGGAATLGAGLSTFLLARISDTGQFGAFLFAVSAVQIAVLYGKQGFDVGATRFLPVHVAAENGATVRSYIRFSQRRVLLPSTVGAVAVLVWLWWKSPLPLPATALFAAAVAVVPASLYGVSVGILRSLGRVPLSTMFNQLAHPAVATTLSVGVWLLGGRDDVTARSLLIAWIVALIIVGPTVKYFVRVATPPGDGESLADHTTWRSTTQWLMLTEGTQRLLGLCDVIIVGLLVNAEAAAIYGVGLRLSRPVGTARLAVSQVVSIEISRAAAAGNFRAVQRHAQLSSRLASLFGLVGLVAVWLFGESVLGAFGADYRAGATTLLLLAGTEVLRALLGPSNILLTMTGLERPALVITIVTLVLNIVVSLVLVNRIGIEGAALGTAAGILFQGIARNATAVRHLGARSTIF